MREQSETCSSSRAGVLRAACAVPAAMASSAQSAKKTALERAIVRGRTAEEKRGGLMDGRSCWGRGRRADLEEWARGGGGGSVVCGRTR